MADTDVRDVIAHILFHHFGGKVSLDDWDVAADRFKVDVEAAGLVVVPAEDDDPAELRNAMKVLGRQLDGANQALVTLHQRAEAAEAKVREIERIKNWTNEDGAAALSVTEETRKDTCVHCGGEIGWVDCPTGSWWAHADHPADEHDAVAASEETENTR